MRARPLAATIAVALLAFAGPAFAAGADDLALLPSDADIVLHLDVKGLQKSSLVQDLIKQAKMNPQAQKELDAFKENYGLDPEKDLNALTIMFPAASKTGQALFVIDSNAKYDRLLAGARKNDPGISEATHSGVKIHQGSKGMAMAAVGDKVLFGDVELLKKAINDRKGKGAQGNKSLMNLVKSTNVDGHLWFVADLPESVRQKMAQGDPELKGAESVRGSLDLSSGLKMQVIVGGDKAFAQKLVSSLDTQLKQAREEQAKNPMMAAMGVTALLEGIKTEVKNGEALLNVDLSDAQVQQLKALVTMAMGMAAAGAMQAQPPAAPAQKAPAQKAPVQKAPAQKAQ
ncbi:MAG: hypothetical protein KC620_02715 [Myxococcales bacterium]|nr:hypothetical protein [Myxococcales bacterium]